jgi:hypothetical protein
VGVLCEQFCVHKDQKTLRIDHRAAQLSWYSREESCSREGNNNAGRQQPEKAAYHRCYGRYRETRAKCLFLKKHFASNEYSIKPFVGEFLKETNNGNDIDFFTRFCDDDDDDPVMMRRKG